MHLDGTWVLPQIDKDMDELRTGTRRTGDGRRPLNAFEWGAFDPPSQVNPLVAAPARSIESSAGEYVSIIDKNQPQTDMVVDFVMFWLSAPGYQAFVDGQVGANEFVPTGKIMVRNVRIPERFERLIGRVKMVGNAEIISNAVFGVAPAGSRLIQDVRQALVELIQGRIGAEEAARRIQQIAELSVVESMDRNKMPLSQLDHPQADPTGR